MAPSQTAPTAITDKRTTAPGATASAATPRSMFRGTLKFWALAAISGVVFVACTNPVDSRRADELASDPILESPRVEWEARGIVKSAGSVVAGQPSPTVASNRWDVKDRAVTVLPGLADHVEAAGWTIIRVTCDLLPARAHFDAQRILDGERAFALIGAQNETASTVDVLIRLTMPPSEQDGIKRPDGTPSSIDRTGTCIE